MLVVFIVLTPLSVAWDWPIAVSTVLLFAVIGLLLVTGQTIIFLLRLVAADRRGRRRPLASGSQTVGELEDAVSRGPRPVPGTAHPAPMATTASTNPRPPDRSSRHRTRALAPWPWPRATIRSIPTQTREDPETVPVLATYFSVRRGRDPFFKFFMRTIFPRQVKDYEEKFGIRFIGWFNVAHGWDFDNVILLDLPDYATLDKLEADEATRALGHRAGEWIFERHHSMFLRERMGPDLEYHP